MPLHSYRCINGHETERLILSINEEPSYYTPCDTCQLTAEHVEFPRTAPPNTFGEGFHHQSLSGPTRRQDPTKLLKDITKSGASFEKS